MQLAALRSKLSDYACNKDNNFQKRLELCQRIGLQRCGGKFTSFGHYMILRNLTDRHVNQLQVVDYIKRHPVVNEVELQPPVFIIGLARTASTLLHELLSLHSDLEVHRTWEQYYSVPETDCEDVDAQEADRQRRYRNDKNFMAFMMSSWVLGDEINSMHRIGYEEIEECTIPMAVEIPWFIPQFYLFAAEEVLPLGPGDAYKSYRRVLKLLTWQSAERRNRAFRWLLKSPMHTPFLPELLDAFPGAVIIRTHRNPADSMASACALTEAIMRLTLEENSIDPVKIGQAMQTYTRYALRRAEETLAAVAPEVKVAHVSYDELV